MSLLSFMLAAVLGNTIIAICAGALFHATSSRRTFNLVVCGALLAICVFDAVLVFFDVAMRPATPAAASRGDQPASPAGCRYDPVAGKLVVDVGAIPADARYVYASVALSNVGSKGWSVDAATGEVEGSPPADLTRPDFGSVVTPDLRTIEVDASRLLAGRYSGYAYIHASGPSLSYGRTFPVVFDVPVKYAGALVKNKPLGFKVKPTD